MCCTHGVTFAIYFMFVFCPSLFLSSKILYNTIKNKNKKEKSLLLQPQHEWRCRSPELWLSKLLPELPTSLGLRQDQTVSKTMLKWESLLASVSVCRDFVLIIMKRTSEHKVPTCITTAPPTHPSPPPPPPHSPFKRKKGGQNNRHTDRRTYTRSERQTEGQM